MKHPLVTTLSSDFAPVIRARGHEYFERGAVRVAEAGPERVLAFVQGTGRHTAALRFEGSVPSMSCTCPFFFDQGQSCKHLWALLLTLDSTGYFYRRGRERAAAREDAARMGAPQEHYPAVDSPASDPAGAPAPVPVWDRALREISLSLGISGQDGRNPWLADRQVFYVLNGEDSRI